jgi:hypothetical protein
MDTKKLAMYIAVVAAIIVGIWVTFVFILPYFQLSKVIDYSFKNATTDVELSAVAKANSLYVLLNSSANRINSNPNLTQMLSEEIGDKSFLLFLISGEHKLWTSYYEIKNGQLVNMEENIEREANCYAWLSADTMSQITDDYKKVAVLFIEGKIKISPPYCYGTFATLARLISEQ